MWLRRAIVDCAIDGGKATCAEAQEPVGYEFVVVVGLVVSCWTEHNSFIEGEERKEGAKGAFVGWGAGRWSGSTKGSLLNSVKDA